MFMMSTDLLGIAFQPSHGLGTSPCSNFWQQSGDVWRPCFRVVAGDTDLGEIWTPGPSRRQSCRCVVLTA